MRPTVNVMERLKQYKNNKEQLNSKRIKKCAQKHPPTHGSYSVEQKQQATRYPSLKDSRRRITVATNCMYPTSATENWILSLLNSYLSRICNNVDNRCPKCDVAPHDVNHIFNCGENTMDLKFIDLWERPVQVAKWLDLIPSVIHDRTSQNNPPSLLFSAGVDDAPPGPPNPRSVCHSPRRRCRKVAATLQASCG